MGVQTRVMSLAAIHREVYQTPGKGEVDAAPLLDAIARQVVQFSSSPDQRIDLRFALDELWLTVDQAVTLALLLGEAVMLATRFAGTSATVPIEVRLSRSASETAILTVTGTFLGLDLHPPGPNDGANALIMQLMAAFAAQLGAEFETKAAGSSFWMTAKFHLQPLIEAELRHAPEAAP